MNWDKMHWFLMWLVAALLIVVGVIVVGDRIAVNGAWQEVDVMQMAFAEAEDEFWAKMQEARILVRKMKDDPGVDPVLRGEAQAFLNRWTLVENRKPGRR